MLTLGDREEQDQTILYCAEKPNDMRAMWHALFCNEVKFFLRESDMRHTLDDSDRRRRGSVCTNHSLHFNGGPKILRIGHAMTDDGAFQSNNRLSFP